MAEHTMSYTKLHTWVRNRLPKPLRCEWCNQEVPLQLANKTNKYLADVSDWLWLCTKCHGKQGKTLPKTHRYTEFFKKQKNPNLIRISLFESTYEAVTAFQRVNDLRSIPHALKRIVEAYTANKYASQPISPSESKPLDQERTHTTHPDTK